MRALQVDRLQRRRDLADGCKGLSSGSPLPMEFHSSSNSYNLDERLQRVKPLCYPPANLIRGKLSFTGVVSITLNL